MKEVLYRLLAIRELAKELHYVFVKEYGLHELYDRVSDGLNEYRDRLTEAGILKAGEFAPSARDNFQGALIALEKVKASREGLKGLCVDTLEVMRGLEVDEGTKAVLDSIAEKLNTCIALL